MAFPRPEQYALTGEQASGAAAVVGEAADRYRAYRVAVDAVLRYHGPEVPGIPIHKLADNSGWIVTRGECRSAMRIYERYR